MAFISIWRVATPNFHCFYNATQATHPGGASHTLDDLRRQDLVGIYLSAKWCTPCRAFTAQLAQVYKELHAADKKFGVLFVSNGDWDQASFQECVQSVAIV